MQTVIHSTDFALTDALDTFIRQQADKAIAVCSHNVDRLTIRLKGLNDPQGNKECRIELKLNKKRKPIVVSKRGNDAYGCIRAALNRTARTALRRVGKLHASKRTTVAMVPT